MGERRGGGRNGSIQQALHVLYKTGRATNHTIGWKWNLWVVLVGHLEMGTCFKTGAGSALAGK